MDGDPTAVPDQRDLLAKEHFLEGNRQKWCLIAMCLNMVILVLSACGSIKDPSPFLASISGLIALLVVGASASDVMRVYTVNTQATGNFTYSKTKADQTSESINKTFNKTVAAGEEKPPIP